MFSNDNAYTGNTFRNNGAGVAVMFSKRITMRENVFADNWGRAAYGLLLKEIYDAEITGNRFQQNTIGILVEGSARVQYERNEFRNNGWAVQMSGGCLDNTFTKNNFVSNAMDLVVHGKINNNTFDENYWSEYTGYDLDRDGLGEVPHRPVKLYSYILSRSPESIVLLRSFFVDLLNFAEQVSPVFTPQNVLDHTPLMQPAS
jgi:nitrous oxidase accessory protein